MQVKVTVIGRELEYTHRISSRTRNVRLTMYPGGKIIITSPARIEQSYIQQFLNRKAKWIIKKFDYLRQFPAVSASNTRQEYLKHKAKALLLVKSRLEYFNQVYGFKYNRVSIKNHRTLWGSCSKKGNLNFSYKLALIPLPLADYVIVHELCHLKEFNHSANFWKLVAQTVPDYKSIRKELKKIGFGIS